MKCGNCNKDITEPIIGIDGGVYCSCCFKPMFNYDFAKVSLTAENMTIYADAEKKIMTATNENSRRVGYSEINKAALSGNPYAMITMGYYYEKGSIGSTNKKNRLFTALRWYDAVARLDNEYVKLTPSEIKADIIEKAIDSEIAATDELMGNGWEKIKLGAIYNIFCLIYNNDLYSLDTNIFKSMFNQKNRLEVLNSLANILKNRIEGFKFFAKNVKQNDSNESELEEKINVVFDKDLCEMLKANKDKAYLVVTSQKFEKLDKFLNSDRDLVNDLLGKQKYKIIVWKSSTENKDIRNAETLIDYIKNKDYKENDNVIIILFNENSVDFKCLIDGKNRRISSKFDKFDVKRAIDNGFAVNDNIGIYSENDVKIVAAKKIYRDISEDFYGKLMNLVKTK